MRLADCWRGSELPYALAHASKTLFWTASDIYFAFYLTQVCGLSPWTMGLVLAASYLVNAAADLILGRRFSATVRSAEQAAQMQASGAALCSITLVLFGLSALVSSGARLAACLLALMAFRLSYSLYDIPQNSLLALAGRDDRMRARLAATRLFISGIARIILTASFVPLFVRRSTEAQIEAFLLLVCLMAFLSLVSAFALRTKLKGAVSAIAFDDASPAERNDGIAVGTDFDIAVPEKRSATLIQQGNRVSRAASRVGTDRHLKFVVVGIVEDDDWAAVISNPNRRKFSSR